MAKNKDTEAFDLDAELEKLEKPNFYIAGLKEFIKDNDVKNQKDFDKLVKDYSEMNIGGG